MPETDSSITPRCVACGSDAVILDAVPSVGGSYTVRVTVYRKPDAKLNKQAISTGGHARVCGDCSFVMIYADEPHVIWDGYIDRLANDLD
jgi:hypothetical protein